MAHPDGELNREAIGVFVDANQEKRSESLALTQLLIVFQLVGAASELEDDQELRSEEHTSELQSPCNLLCRLLLEKKKIHTSVQLQMSTKLLYYGLEQCHVLEIP